MHPIIELLRRQQAAGFPDVAGTQVAATIPLSDRLLNEIIATQLPPSAPVSEVRVEARGANTFAVRARVARATFLPAINMTLGIVRQPVLPHDPVLVLQVASGGLMALAGPVLRGLDLLPPGVRVDGDRILVDVRTILEHRGLGELMGFLEDLRVTSEPRRLIVSLRARLPLS